MAGQISFQMDQFGNSPGTKIFLILTFAVENNGGPEASFNQVHIRLDKLPSRRVGLPGEGIIRQNEGAAPSDGFRRIHTELLDQPRNPVGCRGSLVVNRQQATNPLNHPSNTVISTSRSAASAKPSNCSNRSRAISLT